MKRSLIWLAILVLAGAGLALAQETTTGTIFGRVTDEQGGVIPGATVTVTSAQGEKVAITDANGRYNVPYLTPGTYSVRVELAGFAPTVQDGVGVRLGQRTELVFTLRVGTVAETITVTETSPVVDVTTTTIGGTLDSDVLERVPVGRLLSEVLYLVPGVSSSGLGGRANPSIGGGTALDNSYVVDGVNISGTGYGALGSYSIVYGSLGNGVTYEFIDEIQVKTAGYEAEFGQSTGGVMSVVTKSGTNSYSGNVFAYFEPDGLESDWTPIDWDEGFVNTTGRSRNEVGITLGGPVVQDKAFFFGAVDPQWNTRTFIAPDGFPLEGLGEVDRDRRTVAYAIKGTFQMTSSHRIDASFFGDPSKGDKGLQRPSLLLGEIADSRFTSLDFGGHHQTVRYSGVMSDNWFIEGAFARASERFEEALAEDSYSFTDFTTTPTSNRGSVGFYDFNQGRNKQFQIKSTHLVGAHQIRYGFGFEKIGYDTAQRYSGPTFILPDGRETVTGATVTVLTGAQVGRPEFNKVYRVSRSRLTAANETTQDYLNFFVQDKFDIGDKVTISAGLRYEQQKLVGSLADFTWDNNWAPRLGAIIDPTGRGRAKIYGNWGRYFAKIPNDLAARALAADAGVTRAIYLDENLTIPIPNSPLLIFGEEPAIFDPDAKSTFIDEAVAGFEYEAIPELNLGVRYVYRVMPRVLEDVQQASMVSWFTGNELVTFDYFITNPDDDTEVIDGSGAKFEKPVHTYHAVEFTADKRFSNNWALFASYRWSRLQGTFEGFFRDDNGQSDPGITSLYDFPTNDPLYTEVGVPQFGFTGDIRFLGDLGAGPLPLDRPHQVKFFTTYAFDMGLSTGVGFTVGSGAPLTPLAASPAYTNEGEIPEGPRGSGFETVDGFRTREQNEFSLDLQVRYEIPFGEQTLVLIADMFNLFNSQQVIRYKNYTDLEFEVPDPDFGRPGFAGTVSGTGYQDPRRIRLGVRFEF